MENEVSIKVAKGGLTLLTEKLKVVIPSGEEKEMTGKQPYADADTVRTNPL
jgi:hypothetical protein